MNFADLLEVGQPQVLEMQRVGDSYENSSDPGACEAFTHQVRIVEGVLVQLYRTAAAMARRSEDLDDVAEIWDGMGKFCLSAMRRLESLKQKYPNCGTTELYDLVLDYKLACDKRYNGAMEELACQKTEFPAGILP